MLEYERYEVAMGPSRASFAQHPTMKTLLDPNVEPLLLERFLIEWCARGVYMTEPVEGWIRRAGERCTALGLGKLGRALINHSRHEAGHHLMFIEDTRVLVGRWNAGGRAPLDASGLISEPPSPAIRAYVDLHERTIAGSAPFAQVAIEYEVEGLSVTVLPQLLEQFARVLGQDILNALSFLGEHAELDVGHTSYNRRTLQRFLGERPESLPELISAGVLAKSTYLDFMTDCLERARRGLALEPAGRVPLSA